VKLLSAFLVGVLVSLAATLPVRADDSDKAADTGAADAHEAEHKAMEQQQRQAYAEHQKWSRQLAKWRIDHHRASAALARLQATIAEHEAVLVEIEQHIREHREHILNHARAIARHKHGDESVPHDKLQGMHKRLQDRHGHIGKAVEKVSGHHERVMAAFKNLIKDIHPEKK